MRGFANIYRTAYNKSPGTDKEKTANATDALTKEFDRLKQAFAARFGITLRTCARRLR